MLRSPYSWRRFTSWPVLLGSLAGIFQAFSAIPAYSFILFSAFSTFFIYVVGFFYGWQRAAVAGLVGYAVTLIMAVLMPSALTPLVVMYKFLVYTPVQFSIPIMIAVITEKRINGYTLGRCLDILGYSFLLLATIFSMGVGLFLGKEEVWALLAKLSNEGKANLHTIDGVIQTLAPIFSFLPSMDLLNQVFQIIVCLYIMNSRRPKKMMLNNALGKVYLDRVWIYVVGGTLLGSMLIPMIILRLGLLVASISTLSLFLVAGFDIVYHKLTSAGWRPLYVVLLIFLCYVLWLPLLIFLIIGLVDQFYSLRQKTVI